MIILLFSMHSIFIYVSEQFFKFSYSRTYRLAFIFYVCHQFSQ